MNEERSKRDSLIMMISASILGERKPVIPANADTITIGALKSLASTADCPITSAPTILIVYPTTVGILTPASLSISNIKSIIRASTMVGKGIPCLDAEILRSSGVGVIS